MRKCRTCKNWHCCDSYCFGLAYEQSVFKTLKLKIEQWLISKIEKIGVMKND